MNRIQITHEFENPVTQTPGQADPTPQMLGSAEQQPRLGIGRKFAALRYALARKPRKPKPVATFVK